MRQMEFPTFREMFAGAMGLLRRPVVRPKRSAIDYTLKLSAALRVCNLTHQLHDVMCAVVKAEVERGFATIPGIVCEISCSYQNVDIHLRRNEELFLVDDGKPKRVRLSAEGAALMRKIKRRIER